MADRVFFTTFVNVRRTLLAANVNILSIDVLRTKLDSMVVLDVLEHRPA